MADPQNAIAIAVAAHEGQVDKGIGPTFCILYG